MPSPDPGCFRLLKVLGRDEVLDGEASGKTGAAILDDAFRVWDLASGAERWSVPVDRVVTALAFSEDGRRVALADLGGGLEVRQVSDGALVTRLQQGQRICAQLAFLGDGEGLVSVHADGEELSIRWTAGNASSGVLLAGGLGFELDESSCRWPSLFPGWLVEVVRGIVKSNSRSRCNQGKSKLHF